MADASLKDNDARLAGRPAMHKLKMLPEVTAILNRNGRDVESALVDPENNLLESVRFFLEPLQDGSLPAYNIQRELLAALARLPVDKECLIASGIGKIMIFYTKSKRAELSIRRAAERLVTEWTRPILKRTDDYRKRVLASADYDPLAAALNGGASQRPLSQAEQDRLARAKELAVPVRSNRALITNESKTFTVVPRSSQVLAGPYSRPLGATGADGFRRMKARQLANTGQGPRKAR